MSAVVDWSVPFSLETPQGTLLLNQVDPSTGGMWLLDTAGCSSTRLPRITRVNRAQASGETRVPPFSAGYEMTLKLGAWQTRDEIACDELLQEMWDALMLHVNAIFFDYPIADSFQAGRVVWTPKGEANRMLNGIWAIALPDEQDEGEIAASFTVVSPFPYAWDETETDTAIGGSATVNLHNAGTASFYPVVEVFGPTTGFTLTNHSVVDQNGNALKVVWDASLPGAPTIGGGDFIEFTFFDEKAYKNGNGANAKPGIDILASDFFPLVPGDNLVEIDGASAQVKWQAAWA